jgi:hypothetical protein
VGNANENYSSGNGHANQPVRCMIGRPVLIHRWFDLDLALDSSCPRMLRIRPDMNYDVLFHLGWKRRHTYHRALEVGARSMSRSSFLVNFLGANWTTLNPWPFSVHVGWTTSLGCYGLAWQCCTSSSIVVNHAFAKHKTGHASSSSLTRRRRLFFFRLDLPKSPRKQYRMSARGGSHPPECACNAYPDLTRIYAFTRSKQVADETAFTDAYIWDMGCLIACLPAFTLAGQSQSNSRYVQCPSFLSSRFLGNL